MANDDAIKEALAYAYVLGWYAGTGGATNDSGKIEAMETLYKKLKDKGAI